MTTVAEHFSGILMSLLLLQGGPLKTTVTGVEMFKKILDHGEV